MNNIGRRIAQLRKQNNLSQQDLADKLNVSNKTISKWECGNGTPDVDILNKIATIFNTTLDEIVNGDAIGNNKEKTKTEKIVDNTLGKQKNKKAIVASIISSSTIFIVTISLLLYFFIPRTPKITDSDIFNINQDTLTATCVVDNDNETFSFNGTIEIPRNNRWNLYYDLNGMVEIKSKVVNLQVGDNTYYIVVENTAGEKETYSVTIRRKPLYVVRFNTLGGNEIQNEIVQEGNFATYLKPTRDGYIFNGWDHDFSQPITENITITASWIAKNLTINYFANNDTNASSTQNVTYDSSVILKTENEFYKKGYSLTSWNTKSDGSGISYSTSKSFNKYNIPNNIDLYAQWTINQYCLFATNNLQNAGTVEGTGNFDYNSVKTLTAVTNEGYTWIGWYSKNNILETTSQTLTITIPDSDIEYIAKWSANNYIVSMDVNNGNSLAQNTKELTFGEHFVLPITTRTEAIFLGWFDSDGKQYTNNQGESVITWDKAIPATLIAHYKINEYQVTLTQNNNKAGSVQGAGLKEYGSSVTIKATTNNGYSFIGWYDSTTEITTNNQYTFTMSNYPITYTAKWQAKDYTITMNVNNGVELADNTETVTFDNGYTLPVTTREGYNFAGWYLGTNGTGTQLTDSNGNSLFAWNIAEDTQIYAKWNIITYNITYNLNDGKVTSSNPVTYTIEDLSITINNPIKDGYIFEGWIGTNLAEKTKQLVISSGSFGNKHFAAVWSEDSTFKAISNLNDFLAINNDLNGNYYLTQDIDLTGISFSGFGNSENKFTGNFNGKGYSILNWNTSATNSSLFYNNAGIIKNLGVKSFTFNVNNSGVLACINDGIIYNISANGNIAGTSAMLVYTNNNLIKNCHTGGNIDVKNNGIISGMVGINNGILTNSYSNVNIKADTYGGSLSTGTRAKLYIGGLCGKNSSTGIIKNSFSAGNIDATMDVNYTDDMIYAGGITSRNEGEIINVFRLDSQTIKTWLSAIYSEEGIVINHGSSVSQEYLEGIVNNTTFYAYTNDTNMILNDNAVWVMVENSYPELYWEN